MKHILSAALSALLSIAPTLAFTSDSFAPLVVAQTASAPVLIAGGLREGELEMLRRAEERDAARLQRRNDAWRRDKRKTVSYSDQNRLRNLERRKRDLQKQARGASVGEGLSLSREIDGINDEIRRIRSGY